MGVLIVSDQRDRKCEEGIIVPFTGVQHETGDQYYGSTGIKGGLAGIIPLSILTFFAFYRGYLQAFSHRLVYNVTCGEQH